MLSHMGMCRNFGSAFCKNSLIMGPIFCEKIPNYGSDFQIFFSKIICSEPVSTKFNLLPDSTWINIFHVGSYFIFHIGSSLPGLWNVLIRIKLFTLNQNDSIRCWSDKVILLCCVCVLYPNKPSSHWLNVVCLEPIIRLCCFTSPANMNYIPSLLD